MPVFTDLTYKPFLLTTMKKKNNGFKIGLIVMFMAMTIFYLFPTIQWTWNSAI